MINSLGEVVMPGSTWTNWQVHIPESLITDSTYVGLVYGFIFEETKSICVVDDSLYFSPERIVGYIGTNAPVWPSAVTENYRRTVFFTGRYTDDKIEGYVISNNSAFGAYPIATRESARNTLESFLEKVQARELEEIGRATIIPYSINNTVNDNNESWNAYVHDSILSNPVFCGDVFGKCSNNSIFIYDTLKFPEMKTEKDRIGRIFGEVCDTAVAISCLRNDGNDIIIGEYVDSILRFHLASEGTNPNGTCWKEEEYTRIVIHKREESDSLTGEEIAELKFQLASLPAEDYYPSNEGTILVSSDSEGDVIPADSIPGGESCKSAITQDGIVLNPADPMSAISLANGDGFKPVDEDIVRSATPDGFKPVTRIEPWNEPDWGILSNLNQVSMSDPVLSERYMDLKELVKEYPMWESIGEQLHIRFGDIESIKEISRCFPEYFVRIVADYYAEKHQYILAGETKVGIAAADDFVRGFQLLIKLADEGFIDSNSTALAIAALRGQLAGNNESPEEFSGFKPVDALIEPWHVLPWKRDILLQAMQEEEQRIQEGYATNCLLNYYTTQLERINKYPVLEYIGERINAPIMFSSELERWASIFSDDEFRSIVNCIMYILKATGSAPQIEYIIGGLRLIEKLVDFQAVDLTKIPGET